jgi:outer membrane protein assembly factor BamB
VKIIELPERKTTPRYCVWIDKYIIVSLQEERTLEMFNSITGGFISRYVCKGQPWAITRVDNANFAVAFPYEKTITLMTVLNKYMKMKNGSTPVQTSLEVSAVAFNSEGQIIYAASMTDGSHIEKYDVQGKVHCAVFLENSSGGIYNITYDSKLKYLFASCHEPDKVVCLDINGTNIFEYSEETLKKPWSVVLDDTDNVYITSYKGQCIHQLNKKGILKNKVVSSNGKAFIHPLGMCFNQYKNRFVLLFAESATMQIFKL